MSFDTYKSELKEFCKKAGGVKVDPSIRWSGVACLSRFIENINKLAKDDSAFAESAILHKIAVLKDFFNNSADGPNPIRPFQDAFVGMYNLGIIEKDKVYRASQPSMADVEWLTGQIGIRAIINLSDPSDPLWEGFGKEEEHEYCAANWVEYEEIPIEVWDDPPPPREQIDLVISKINYYLKPIIVHDTNGIDKVSLAAGAYNLSHMGKKWSDVEEDLEYYHFETDRFPNLLEQLKTYEKVAPV